MHDRMPDAGRAIVLVVDDDVDHAGMLEMALEEAGFGVRIAHSCREARAALAAEHVDALVCDLTLGDGTAIDVLAGARRRPAVAIVLTGFDTDHDVERTRAAGFDAYFVKPASIEAIAAAIDGRLSRSRRSSS